MIQQEEDSPQALSDKDIETVDNYIQSLERTNPKLAEIIRNLWKEVQANPKDYQGQSITGVLDSMIEAIIDDHLKRFARNGMSDSMNFVTMSNTIVRVPRSNLEKASSPRANATKTTKQKQLMPSTRSATKTHQRSLHQTH